MTRRVEEPEPVRDGAGQGLGDEPTATSGSGGAVERPSVDAPRVDAGGLDVSRPWQQVAWVVVDVEGNGQRPPDLVEAACLPIDGAVPGEARTWLVRPPRPITGLVRRIHGIRDADVATAPATADVAQSVSCTVTFTPATCCGPGTGRSPSIRVLADAMAARFQDTLPDAVAAYPGSNTDQGDYESEFKPSTSDIETLSCKLQ